MTDDVYQWSLQEKLIEPGDFVLAGVSGGADSVCLLLLLLEFQKKMDFALEVVHVEHGIRGAESKTDATFVEKLCEKFGIPCHICSVDVPGYAAEHGQGIEEAARILRYEAYRTVAERISGGYSAGAGGDVPSAGGSLSEGSAPGYKTTNVGKRRIRIALAHHADDNAETVLFQLVRGSGLRGLGGMQPMRSLADDVAVIRPLLMTPRSAIEAYLTERGQEYRTDSTNLDTDYSRNRIRHAVLPELMAINPQAVSHITKSAALLSELGAYVEGEAAQIRAEVCEKMPDGCRISQELFLHYPVLLQSETVLAVMEDVAGSRKDIGSVHVEAVLNLSGLQVGRSLDLPYGMRAERTYDGGVYLPEEAGVSGVQYARERESAPDTDGKTLCDGALLRADKDTRGREKESYEISRELLLQAESGEKIMIPLSDGEIHLRVLDFRGEMREIPKKAYTKWLNYDKIECNLHIRKRVGGDYLVIDEAGHRKKLKEYFIEAKIPREQRDNIWLLAAEDRVIWAVGARIGADYKVSENTRRILEVQIIGGKYREDQEH